MKKIISTQTHIVIIGFLLILGTFSFFFIDHPLARSMAENPKDVTLTHSWAASLKQLGNSWVQVWLLLLWTWLTRRPRVFVTGIVALLLVSCLVWSLKLTTHRARPRETYLDNQHKLYQSFPSGDAASACTVAVVAATVVSLPTASVLFSLAGIVGILRVTSLAHYPSDICAAMIFGILCGLLAFKIVEKWIQWDWIEMQEKKWKTPPLIGLALIPALISLLDNENYLALFLRFYWPVVVILILKYELSQPQHTQTKLQSL